MPLTVGKLGESRPLGGTRGVIRREIRRAKREGNTALANQLGGQIAQLNIQRGLRGDSLIGSADSDAREVAARRSLQSAQLGETARLASQSFEPRNPETNGNLPTQPVPEPSTPQIDTSLRGETPGPVGPTTTAAPGAAAPSTDSITPAEPTSDPSVDVVEGNTPPPSTVTESRAEPQSTPESLINGLPARQAISRSRFDVEARASIARGELPEFNDEDTGLTGEELSAKRRAFYSEFEEEHGREALLERLTERANQSRIDREEQDRLREARTPINSRLLSFARESFRREVEAEDPFSDEAIRRGSLDYLDKKTTSAAIGASNPVATDAALRRSVERKAQEERVVTAQLSRTR